MSFRVLIAVAARFDLELLQYDAVNAFVHADLDETVYMELPPGYRVPGRILRLRKALYGLRRENCCWQKGEVMFFFYVDDCVLAFPRARKEAALREVSKLQKRYHFEGGGDLQWFLGIEVIRDRATRRLWLSQAVYAEKVRRLLPPTANALEDGSEARSYTPMVLEELLPYEGEASA
nr:polyprotein [Colletotrichum truncatum]KAF6780949.1 polyprotein [Colletotrichum truncatum]